MFSTRRRHAAWLLSLVAVAAIAGAGVAYRQHYTDALVAVREQLSVERAASEIFALVRDAETSQRGFVLTGQPAFLAPHASAQSALPKQLERLQRLAAARPELRASVERLRVLVDDKMKELTETIALRRAGRAEEALAIIEEGRGRRLMGRLREQMTDLLRVERGILARYQAEAQAKWKQLFLVTSVSWIGLVVAVGAGIWSARRGLAESELVGRALREKSERLQSVLASMGDGVVVLGLDRRVIAINASGRRFVAWNEGDEIASDWSSKHAFLLDGKTPCPVEQAPMTLALRGRIADDARLMVKTPDGELRTVSVNARPIYDGDKVIACVAVLHDISERRRCERELQESEERLRVLSNASFDGIAITEGRRIIDVNDTLASWVGRTRDELVGADGLHLFEQRDRAKVTTYSAQAGSYEARLLRPDGGARPVEVRGTFTHYRGRTVRIAVVRDITDRLQRETVLKEHGELMRMLSLRDELTGLYNRRGFSEVAEQALRALARSNAPACLFFADLNGLKQINDTLGHEVGDEAIMAAAKVLSHVFREADVVARLGGDEFAVLALRCAQSDIPLVLKRIDEQVSAANRMETRFVLSISIGTALFQSATPVDLNALMDSADQAMYQKKRSSSARRLA